jgi:hypothetical protein
LNFYGENGWPLFYHFRYSILCFFPSVLNQTYSLKSLLFLLLYWEMIGGKLNMYFQAETTKSFALVLEREVTLIFWTYPLPITLGRKIRQRFSYKGVWSSAGYDPQMLQSLSLSLSTSAGLQNTMRKWFWADNKILKGLCQWVEEPFAQNYDFIL